MSQYHHVIRSTAPPASLTTRRAIPNRRRTFPAPFRAIHVGLAAVLALLPATVHLEAQVVDALLGGSQRVEQAVFAPGVVSSPDSSESSPSVTDDGRTLVFTRYESYGSQVPHIATRTPDGWRVRRAPFADLVYNLAISPDGGTILFRPARTAEPDGPSRVLRVRRSDDGSWGEPREVAELRGVNAGYFDIRSDGTLYLYARPPADAEGRAPPRGVHRTRLGADGTYGPMEFLGHSVSPAGSNTFDPELIGGGRTMIVSRSGISDDEEAELGRMGLYLHRRTAHGWDAGQRLPLPYGWGATLLPDGRLLFVDEGDVQVVSVQGQPGVRQIRTDVRELAPETTSPGLRFGRSVAVAGDLVVVGATGEATFGEKSGAVYVFERAAGEWRRTRLLPPDGEPEARFGWKVATDGERIAVAAPWASNPVEGRSGTIYLYGREGGGWAPRVLRVRDAEIDGQVGRGLAMVEGRIVVGAPFDSNANGDRAGAVVVFEEGPEGWTSTTLIPREGAPEGWFGLAVAARGERILASGYATPQEVGPEAGAVSLFERDAGGAWVERPLTSLVRPEARDHLGRGLALGSDVAYLGAEEDDNVNGTNAGGVFALRLDAPRPRPRLVIPDDGAPRSYLGFTVAITDRHLAASEDDEVRLFELGSVPGSGPRDRRLSEVIGRSLTSGVLALSGAGRLLVVGMPFDDDPVPGAGTVFLVEFDR